MASRPGSGGSSRQHPDVVHVEVGEQQQLDVLDAQAEAGEEDVGRCADVDHHALVQDG
jgi:hypothetical protein